MSQYYVKREAICPKCGSKAQFEEFCHGGSDRIAAECPTCRHREEGVMEESEAMWETWQPEELDFDHSVTCSCCGNHADERECLPGEGGEGSLCRTCVDTATRIRTEDGYVFSKADDGSWTDGDLTFDTLGDLEVSFSILE